MPVAVSSQKMKKIACLACEAETVESSTWKKFSNGWLCPACLKKPSTWTVMKCSGPACPRTGISIRPIALRKKLVTAEGAEEGETWLPGFYPPNDWTLYRNGDAKNYLCPRCYGKTRRLFTIKWPVFRCVGHPNSDSNAVEVTLPGNSKSGTVTRYIPLAEDTPKSDAELLAWAAKKLHREPNELTSAKMGFSHMDFLEPFFDVCWRGATFASQYFFRHERIPHGPEDELVSLNLTEATQALKKEFYPLSHIADSIVRDVLKQYARQRPLVFHKGRSEFLTFKNGFPVPLRKGKVLPIGVTKDGHAQVEITLCKHPDGKSHGAQKLVLELQGGKKRARDLTRFREALKGDTFFLASKLIALTKANKSFRASKLMLHIGVDAPDTRDKSQDNLRRGTLWLETGKNFFVALRVNNIRRWPLSGDNCARNFKGLKHQLETLEERILRHKYRLKRMSMAFKFEKRVSHKSNVDLEALRDKMVEAHAKWMHGFIEESTTELANFAARHRGGFKTVVFDNTVKGWPKGDFPWFTWIKRLREKLQAYGIELLDKDGNKWKKDEDEESEE